MSRDFLSMYTIPTVHQPYTEVPVEYEANNQYVTSYETPNIARYIPPGKQDDIHFVEKAKNSLKRTYANISNKSHPVAKTETENFIGKDPSYPEELNKLIAPLNCGLCKVELNSKKTANCHYTSKPHDRKITAWLAQHYPENPPEVKRFFKEGPSGPEALHCDICDLPLTSLSHAKQHYDGRKHRLAANQKKDPSGAGYYDFNGKWVRTATKKSAPKSTDIRYGIGEAFVPSSTPNESNGSEAESQAAVASPKATEIKTTPLFCEICKITATSSGQMVMHLSGSKHKKKMAAKDMLSSPEIASIHANFFIENTNENGNGYLDYRTPTGSYYCQICNTSMNNIPALQQHLQGKKHKAKSLNNQSNPEISPAK